MSVAIPLEISEEEILTYFIFDKNFKGKIIEEKKLISKDVFLPNKGGVSLQRQLYCDETTCKIIAKSIEGKRHYVGFLIFRKSCFEKVKATYQEERSSFEAEIQATPLDENFKYIDTPKDLFTDSPGNPAHADLKYINPAMEEGETPNTAIRSFSRKLAKVCTLVIDESRESLKYVGKKFDEII